MLINRRFYNYNYERDTDGQLVGGPAYYIKNGLGSTGLASFFAVALILALGFIGNMVQSNSIADAVSRAFNIPQIAVGVVIEIFAGLIFIGGMKRIASFAELVVPFNIAFGPFGQKFLAICLTFFAFTTVVGWYYFGENNVRFLFENKKAIKVYQVIVLIFIVLGSYQKVDLVWDLADMFNGIMVIPNLIGIFFLFKHSKAILKDYDSQVAKGEKLHFDYEFEK